MLKDLLIYKSSEGVNVTKIVLIGEDLRYVTTAYLSNPNIKFQPDPKGKSEWNGMKGTWVKKEEIKSENKIITFDIETVLKKGKMLPYLICMYDGCTTKKWFIESAPGSNPTTGDAEAMVMAFFKELLQPKYANHLIYAHNLSRFDLTFIFRVIAKLGMDKRVRFVMKEQQIIGIKILIGK